jgi:predicted nucleic acid-binding protein
MQFLLDTGILLRLVNREAESHSVIRAAVRRIKANGDITVTSVQNACEFWNVSTRPVESRGGFGLTSDEARRRLSVIERIATILPYPSGLYSRWKQLVISHGVKGVQVHDAKIAALMQQYNIDRIVTLNPSDFGYGIRTSLRSRPNSLWRRRDTLISITSHIPTSHFPQHSHLDFTRIRPLVFSSRRHAGAQRMIQDPPPGPVVLTARHFQKCAEDKKNYSSPLYSGERRGERLRCATDVRAPHPSSPLCTGERGMGAQARCIPAKSDATRKVSGGQPGSPGEG